MDADTGADLGPLAALLGTWRGGGTGEYPTMEPFPFEEETRFWHPGAGFLYYHLRSWDPRTGAHMHSELGFWRLAGDGRLDVTLAHPLGLTEIAEGTVAGGEFRLASRSVERTSENASPVTTLERRYTVAGEELSYDVLMALDTVPLALHITGTLRRVHGW
jgi:hypothetical protein